MPFVESAPTWMRMPETAQAAITVVLAAVVASALVVAAVAWRRGQPVYAALLLGGALCSLLEPVQDILMLVYHPEIGNWKAYEAWGLEIPVWVVLAWSAFYGILGSLLLALVRRGVTRAQLWAGLGAVLVAEMCLEIPLLQAGVYTYYGGQPFQFGGFVFTWFFVYGAGVMITPMVLTLAPGLFAGWRVWLIIPAMPFLNLATTGIGFPIDFALNAGAAPAVKWAAAAATIALGAWLFDRATRLVAEPQSSRISTAISGQARLASQAAFSSSGGTTS